jgi:hypothetical protein
MNNKMTIKMSSLNNKWMIYNKILEKIINNNY